MSSARGGFDVEHHEARAQAFDLFLDGGADVVAADHRAQPARGGDGLQSGDARADHQHARRRDRSRGGHQHGEHAGQGIGGDQHRLVAGDGGHGGQRVHALRARDARHQLHGQKADAALGQRAGRVDRGERLAEADDRLAAAQQRQVRPPVSGLAPGLRTCSITSAAAKTSSRPARRTPFSAYSESGKPARMPGAGFHDQFRARLIENADRARDHGHPALAGGRFLKLPLP